MFETRFKDAMGRVGYFSVGGKTLETPLLLPVLNPNLESIPIKEIKEIGFEAVITNSYIIYRNEKLKQRALENGVKGLLGFDGAVFTDSGSFQLAQYGEVEISSDEIVKFQEEIGSNVGVILDIPTPPDVSHSKTSKDLEETFKRAKSAVNFKKDMLLAGTIQGSTHLDLREKSAKDMASLDFDIYPIGGVVQLMESYRFADLARIIIHSKRSLPQDKPIHLFGAGHPFMLPLAVALGCDIFDSAAYSLYARDGRYISSTGTLRLDDMKDLPCNCKVCSDFTAEELRNSDKKESLLALHNLHITFKEIKKIKEAISRGSLWELVENQCRVHPKLLEALRILKDYPLEKFEPLSKRSAFFYSGPESLYRPEVKRHIERLSRLKTEAKTLVLLHIKKMRTLREGFGSNKDYQVCYLSPVFGIIPVEIEEVYPLSQHLCPDVLDDSQILMMTKKAGDYAKGFERILVDEDLEFLSIKGEKLGEIELKMDTSLKIRALGDYQFGKDTGKVIFEGCTGRYARNGRLRHIFHDETLIATVRASDGIIIPSYDGAKNLLKLTPPQNRVIVEDEEVCGFIREGKSVFAKFIIDCDPEIASGSEVIVVDTQDELVGWGRAVLDARELISFKAGVGVKTRGSIPS
jgi:7-cyano-7-deazaguanine tRNA-ribosyltransferase